MKPFDLPIAVAQALLADSPAGIAVYAGETGECLLANKTLAVNVGGSVEALQRQHFRCLASWRDSGLTDAAESTLSDGVPRHHEATMQTSFSKSITLDCFFSRFDFEGKPHLMLIATDVTERRRAEQALAVREEELRTLIDTVPDLIVRYDKDLCRTYVNPAWEQASGLSAKDVINVPADAIPKVPKPANVEYVQKVRQVLETGIPQSIDFTWVNALGTELYLEYVIVPEHDRSGEISGVLAVGRDLSEHHRIEEALQKSENLLNATQLLTKVGGWGFDVISGKAFWTEELYRIHEIPNDPGMDYIKESLACYRPEDRQIIHDAFQRACEQGESYDLEFPFTTYTGKPLWIRTTAQPVHEEGKVVRLIGNLMDITERKRAEEALHFQTVELEEEVAERQMAQESLQEKALLLEEEIEKRQRTQEELEQLNEELEQRVKERTAELEEKNAELHKMNRLFVGRELRMVELKERIKELEEQQKPV
jgi:PAS domain S-box-containing protein